MSVYEAVVNLVGPVPAGYEPLVWIASALILIYLVTSMFSIIASILTFATGGK